MIGSKTALAARLASWYRRARRDLPWRVSGHSSRSRQSNPYHLLVSEIMLQQTRVATVVPYFLRFLRVFPTIAELARADEQRVLRLWQGLGYYTRALNLHRAAQMVMRDFGGEIPRTLERLGKLPGVGRYTAGAVASLAFGQRVPIVDGNVLRVLCRIDRIQTNPRESRTLKALWRRAEELLPQRNAGVFNSALMELGATVCTPKSPKCHRCPIRMHCQAFADNVQLATPLPSAPKRTPLLRRKTICIRREDGKAQHWLIEQRQTPGRWAGMWQFVTRPATKCRLPLRTTRPRLIGRIAHALTHRRYLFDVYVCAACGGRSDPANFVGAERYRWIMLHDLDRYPLPRPQLRIAQMLRNLKCTRPSRM